MQPSSNPPPPGLNLRRAVLSDCGALARLERASFSPSALFALVWSAVSPEDYQHQSQYKLEKVVTSPQGKQCVIVAEQAGGLVGFALWSAPSWADHAAAAAAGGPAVEHESGGQGAAEAGPKTAAVPTLTEPPKHTPGYNVEQGRKYFGQPSSRPAYPNLGQ